MSMLTHDQLYYVMMRIKSVSGYKDMQELLDNKLIILTGDLFQNMCLNTMQLPPVCPHKVTMNDDGSTTCKKCHLTSSMFWNETENFDIEGSVRHNADAAFAQFCNVICKQIPTQNQIDTILSACTRISKEEVAMHAAPTPGAGADASDLSTVLCTHNRDVDTYNQSIINHLYGPQVLQVPLDFFANKEREELNTAPLAISNFLEKKGFHKLTHVAIGAPVFLTTNTNTALNGDAGTVVEFHMQEDQLNVISVK
eukprot:233590-Pelagomonas_calceolata.AAC.1